MAGRVQIEVLMPEETQRWRPAMVTKVTREPMVEVLLFRNRYRVKRAFREDLRVQLFRGFCDQEGVAETIREWPRMWEEFTRARREWMQRLGIW